MSLYTELRRRNVFKVAAVYAVAAWLLIRVVHNLHPVMGLPHWTERLVGLMLLVGLPLALYFAYIYEITPVGLKKAVDVDQTQSIVYKTGQKLNAALAVMLVLLLAVLLRFTLGLAPLLLLVLFLVQFAMGATNPQLELFARELHRRSNRSEGPFIVVNCGAIPDHLVESEFFGYRKGSFTGATLETPSGPA